MKLENIDEAYRIMDEFARINRFLIHYRKSKYTNGSIKLSTWHFDEKDKAVEFEFELNSFNIIKNMEMRRDEIKDRLKEL